MGTQTLCPPIECSQKRKLRRPSTRALEAWHPQPNGHAHLATLRILAENVNSTDKNELLRIFERFLPYATLDEWHLLLLYIWSDLLGPIERKLHHVTGEVVSICSASPLPFVAQQTRDTEILHNAAFNPPATESYPTYLSETPAVSKEYLLLCVVQALTTLALKRKWEMDARMALDHWRRLLG